MTESPTPSDQLADNLVARTAKLTDNTAQEMIIVTRDKVELALHRNLPKYVPTGKLLASFGLALALITTLLTAQFQTFLGISGATWQGFFMLALAGSVILVAFDFVRWVRRPSLDDLVDSIEKDSRVNGTLE